MACSRCTVWPAALLLGARLALGAAAGAQSPTPATPDPGESSYVVLLQKGVALVKAHRPQEAIDDYFDKIIASYATKYADAKAQLYCSHTQTETLLYTLSGAAKEKDALVVGPTWCDALYAKGYALIDLNRLGEAEDSINRARALAPENPEYLSELGHIFSLRKQWPEAIEMFVHAEQSAVYAAPKDVTTFASRACRGIGYALTEQNKLEESEANYRRCLSIDPADQKSMLELRYIGKLRTGH
jgi:Flp pilus assembly protein TadD